MPGIAVQGGLLSAPVIPLILRLALPGMLGMIASAFSTLFDALIISRAGTQSAAAVSLSFPILTLIQTIGFTLGMGAGSFVSRSIGSGDKPAAFRAASTAFFFGAALSTLLCVFGFVFAVPLVRLLGANEALAASAAAYARFVLASGPMLCTSLILSSLLRGQGQILSNLIAFSLGAAVSVLLDWLLVVRLSLSVTGAGIAMLARETVTLCVLLIFLLRGKSLIRPTLRSFSLRKDVFFGIMRFGLPTLLRQGLMSLSSILLTRAASGFGAAVLAGSGLTVRVCALVSSAMIGFGQGFQPVCGAASGAGNTQRIKKAYSFCMLCMLIASVFVGISVFFFSDFLLSPFAPDKETALFAAAGLRAQSVTFFAMGAVIMMNMLTQAMGLTIRASLIATSRQGFLFIPLIMLLPRLWGAAGLVICQSISDLLSLALCFFITKKGITGSSSARGGCSDARTAFQSDRHS